MMHRVFVFFSAFFLALIIKFGVELSGHTIAWVWAALIGFVVVYGGFLIIDSNILD